jgi:CheY-like chemotaxis protein
LIVIGKDSNVENLYNRVENLDELIRSVKLPYLAWKVLFLVNKNATSQGIADLLETGEDAVSKSMQLLADNGLVVLGETEGQKSDIEEAPVEPEVKPEVTEEKIAEEIVEESEATEVLDELLQESEPEPQTAGEELFEETIPVETVEPESLLKETEEDNILDDLLEETSEQEAATEPELEEEKIEINIAEGDEGDDISDDMEFNFNLTGDEKTEEKVETPEPSAETQEEGPDKSGYKKILVIDDSLVIRKMVEIALEEEELTIETAVSGKEGLEVMDQTNPDLVILDMMLPDINGIEILKTIKASKGIPVIMLSGKDSPQMIETAKNEGAEEFLPKPFKDDDLVEKIKKLI